MFFCLPLNVAEEFESPTCKYLKISLLLSLHLQCQMQNAVCVIVSYFCLRNDDSMLLICVNWFMFCCLTEGHPEAAVQLVIC